MPFKATSLEGYCGCASHCNFCECHLFQITLPMKHYFYLTFYASTLMIAYLLLSGPSLVFAQAESKQADTPSKQDIERSSTLLREVYRKQIEEAKTPSEKTSLAMRFLSESSDVGVLSDQFVMLNAAEKLSISAGNMALLRKVHESMSLRFKIDEIAYRSASLLSIDSTALVSGQRLEYLEQIAQLCAKSINSENFDVSHKLSEIANDIASSTRDQLLKRRIQALVDYERECRSLWTLANRSVGGVDQSSTKSQAMANYLCFVKRDWEKGLAIMATSGDAQLRSIAARDLRAPATSEEQLGIADAWWELSQSAEGVKSAAMRSRALQWYRIVATQLSGLSKSKATNRLSMGETNPPWSIASELGQAREKAMANADTNEPRDTRWTVNFHTWSKGQPPVRLIHKNEGICYLSRIQGAFFGGAEIAEVYIDKDGFWYLRGNSLQKELSVTAVSVKFK